MMKVIALMLVAAITASSTNLNFSQTEVRSNLKKGDKTAYSRILKERGVVPRVQLQKHNIK